LLDADQIPAEFVDFAAAEQATETTQRPLLRAAAVFSLLSEFPGE